MKTLLKFAFVYADVHGRFSGVALPPNLGFRTAKKRSLLNSH